MNVCNLYASKVQGPNTQAIKVGKNGVLFIRVAVSEDGITRNMDVGDALDKANPREGETVLNSVEFTKL